MRLDNVLDVVDAAMSCADCHLSCSLAASMIDMALFLCNDSRLGLVHLAATFNIILLQSDRGGLCWGEGTEAWFLTTALSALLPTHSGLSVDFFAIMAALLTQYCLVLLNVAVSSAAPLMWLTNLARLPPSVHDMCRVLIATSMQLWHH